MQLQLDHNVIRLTLLRLDDWSASESVTLSLAILVLSYSFNHSLTCTHIFSVSSLPCTSCRCSWSVLLSLLLPSIEISFFNGSTSLRQSSFPFSSLADDSVGHLSAFLWMLNPWRRKSMRFSRFCGARRGFQNFISSGLWHVSTCSLSLPYKNV